MSFYAWEEKTQQLIVFLQNEVSKRGFSKVVYGLSGGLDSAIVAKLCQMAFGSNAMAILMPTSLSSKEHLQDALELVTQLQIPYKYIPLSPYEEIFKKYQGINPLRFGNLCARTRMMILYDKAQEGNALVIGTSNKSERMLGYGTIYGDLACAINPIGDFFKTELFEYATFLNLPTNIIQKKPSADLYEGQSDEEELGFSYKEIDLLLRQIAKKNLKHSDFEFFDTINPEVCQNLLRKISERVRKNSFKLEHPSIFLNS